MGGYLHMINCLALAYGPYYVVYKSSKLPDHEGFWVPFYAMGAYIATQFVKMLIIATFLPAVVAADSFDIVDELMKATASYIDVAGLYLLASRFVRAPMDIKTVGVGLGWAFTESVLVRIAPIWMGARKLEFSWEFVQMAIQSNLSIVFHMAFTTFVVLHSHKNSSVGTQRLMMGMMLLYPAIPLLMVLGKNLYGVDSWMLLLVETGLVLGLGVAAKQMFVQLFLEKRK
eukprot:TRINITY_DN1003_c0_g1_i1.p1 TRINITY_DN1003_c0_g1~~TRINITY_DN1003_c0_g1_i1.p1  ORF type:complete len:229 (+),score=68.89 TRINITY_DN1003_c0_g1_i1:486-1172(+)